MSDKQYSVPSKTALSAIFSNMSKASAKQQLPEKADLFKTLSSKYWKPEFEEKTWLAFKDLISNDLGLIYPELQTKAEKIGDRGVLRALSWGKKVTTIQKSLVDRYTAKGEALIENNDLYVCEACGFIYLGTKAPDLCPVCKAPKSRFVSIK